MNLFLFPGHGRLNQEAIAGWRVDGDEWLIRIAFWSVRNVVFIFIAQAEALGFLDGGPAHGAHGRHERCVCSDSAP